MVIDNQQIVEALLFASDSPLSGKKIREIIPEIANEKQVKKIISQIDEKYETTNSPLKIVELAGGYQIVTRDTFSTWISQLYKSRSRQKLTRKGLETLAIIAYKQPVTKTQLEQIRGVNCDYSTQKLLEKELIEIKGKAETPGRPLLFGTSTKFMEYFGINDLNELPTPKDFPQDDNKIGEEDPDDNEEHPEDNI